MESIAPVASIKPSFFAFRSLREIGYTLRVVRYVAFAVHSLILWIFCAFFRFNVYASSPSPALTLVEGEGMAAYLRERSRLDATSMKKSSPACEASRRRILALHSIPSAAVAGYFNGGHCRWEKHLFTNPRKQIIFAQSWTPSDFKTMKALVVLLHGLNEHSGRYVEFALHLNSRGYGVYAMDWIGHGGSDGLHGYVPSLDYVVSDTRGFTHWVKDMNPSVPCFLFGHSTGGALALKAAFHPSVEKIVKGVVLTSPALRVQPSHPVFEVIAPIFAMLFPTFQFKGANKCSTPVSRDPEQLVLKYSDPLVYTGQIRARTGCEILRITSYLQRNMKRVTVPFLVMHGTADSVTDPLASQELYNYAAAKNKWLKLYDGYLHDLLFEPERKEITEDIIKWLDIMLTRPT